MLRGDVLEELCQLDGGVDQLLGHLLVDAVLLGKPDGHLLGALPDLDGLGHLPDVVYPEVGFVYVAVVGLELLLPDADGDAALLVEASRLPVDLPACLQDLGLADHFESEGLLNVLQSGDVLDLDPLLPDGDVAVAPNAALPVSGKVDDASDVLDQLSQELPRLGGGGDVRLGDDLRQGYPGAVVVHQGREVPDPLGLPGILLHVYPGDPDGLLAVQVVHPSLPDRVVVLGDLDALRHVGVEVGLPGEPGGVGDLAPEELGQHDPVFEDLPVEHRPGSGHAQACGAHMRVGSRGLGGGTGAEHLGLRRQLHVDLESYLHADTSGLLISNSFSQASAMEKRTSSSQWSATNCIPTGIPSDPYPQGTDMCGVPAMFAGTVR